jgi:hypothetical protein
MTLNGAPARLSLLIAIMLSAVLAPVASAAEETPDSACLYPSAHQRFAFSVGGAENGGINAFNVAPLSGGAYLDWWANADAPHPGGIDYLPMIHVDEFLPDWQPEGYSPSGAYLQLAIRNNLGATWLIGNEAEYRGDHDHATPEGYARIYHDIYHTIKSADPSAKVAMNGFATVSPLRLAWLDRAWQAYRSMYGVDMPVDVWNFHGYIVNEMVHEWGPDLPYGFVNAVGYGAGEWIEVDDAAASGGTYHKSHNWGARAYFAFEGDAVTVFLFTGPDAGLADIFIDARLVQTIDLYTPSPGLRRLTFDNLPPSPHAVLGRRHHIRVGVNGLKNAAASDNWVRVDAIVAESTASLPNGRLEDNSPLRATIITHPDEVDDLSRILEQVRMMRQWMADHGQRNKPLINTEYGILLNESTGFDQARVRRFMVNTFDLFYHSPEIIDPAIGMPDDGGRMLQQWFWFILSNEERYFAQVHTSLMSPVNLQLLPLGQEFGNYVRNLVSHYADVAVEGFQASAQWALFSNEASLLQATGWVQNMGDRPTGSFWVRLDSNGAMLQQWQVPGLSPRHGGNDRFWVDHSWQTQVPAPPQLTLQADLAGQVGEPCDPNNTLTFTFPAVQQPDLAVASLAMTPATPTGNTTSIRLSATAANLTAQGTSDDRVRVRFWDGEPGAGGTLLHTHVIERGSNANVTTVSYDWQGFAPGPHTVVIEVAPATDETGVANNRQQISFFVPQGQNFIYVPILTRSRGNAAQGAPGPAAMPSYKSSPRLDLFQ